MDSLTLIYHFSLSVGPDVSLTDIGGGQYRETIIGRGLPDTALPDDSFPILGCLNPPLPISPLPMLVWQCALMLAVRRLRAQQVAMVFAGPPLVEAAHYVWCSSATKRRARLRRAMAPPACRRAACHNAEISDTRRGRDRTASPPAPFTMHGAGREARAGWRAVVPSGARPPDKRGTVRDAGRGGRRAPSTTILYDRFSGESGIGNRSSGNHHREGSVSGICHRGGSISGRVSSGGVNIGTGSIGAD